MPSSPKAKTVACDFCCNMIKAVVTDCSPATAVVDFQTSFAISAARTSKSHRPCIFVTNMHIDETVKRHPFDYSDSVAGMDAAKL